MLEGIEINARFAEALHIMEETNQNLFITGRAGTGTVSYTHLDVYKRQ